MGFNNFEFRQLLQYKNIHNAQKTESFWQENFQNGVKVFMNKIAQYYNEWWSLQTNIGSLSQSKMLSWGNSHKIKNRKYLKFCIGVNFWTEYIKTMFLGDKCYKVLWILYEFHLSNWQNYHASLSFTIILVGWSLGACRLGAWQLGQMTVRCVYIIFPTRVGSVIIYSIC